MVLSKPIEKLEIAALANIHEVLPKETRYSIAKLYGISLSDLVKANPIMGDKSLKIVQKITIPTKVENHINLVAKVEVSNIKKDYKCNNCDLILKHLSSLSRHKKKCLLVKHF